MDFIQYIRLLRKWLWLIVLTAFVAGGISFIVNTGRPLIYTAQTIVSIGNVTESPNPDYVGFRTSIELAQTYIQILKTYDLLQSTVEALGLNNVSPDGLRGLFDTQVLEGTSLMVISVSFTDPVQAADMANALAEQLIKRSPGLSPGEQERLDFAIQQVDALNVELSAARQQLQLLDNQISAATVQSDIDNLKAQRLALTTQINQTTSSIAQFSSQIIQLQQRQRLQTITITIERLRVED